MLSKYQCLLIHWIEISIKHFKFADVLLEKGDFDMAYIFIIFC